MSQYTSYWLYQKYEKRGDQDWLPCYPNVLSVDADGTRQRVVKEENDTGCGYTPEPDAEYRWIQVPISEDYICDYCPIYRWHEAPVTDYYCSGTTKWTKEYYQCSLDNGVTWNNVVPEQTRKGNTIIEEESMDCGYVPPAQYEWRRITPVSGDDSTFICDTCYVPPTPTFDGKFRASYNDSTTYSAACNGNTSLTTATTRAHSTSYTAMTTAEIGYCITSIGSHSFFGCRNLTNIIIPNTVTSIGDYAFYSCSGMTSITIPSGVTTISEGVFARCTGLTSVNIPSDVTSIGEWAFNSCTSLQSITVNATIPPTLGNTNAFDYTNNCPIYVPCASVGTYKAASGWSTYASRIQGIPPCGEPTPTGGTKFYATYTGGTTYSAACDGNTTLTSGNTRPSGYDYYAMQTVEIGNCVTSVGYNAFYLCDITSVTIPDSVTSIGDYAFQYCTSLTSITIPDSVTTIDDFAFQYCYSLTSCTIGTGVTSIGAFAFNRCDSLTSVTINATTPPTLGNVTFDNYLIYVPCNSVNAYKTAWSAYASRIQGIPPCSEPTPTFDGKFKATYTGGTTYSAACDDNTTLTLENARPSGYNYYAMQTAEIGSCITSIDHGAFAHCTGLTSVTIPDSVTSIGSEAFFNCKKLTSVTVNATTPPALGNTYVFEATPIVGSGSGNGYIYVPSASVNAYKSEIRWSNFASKIRPIT